MHADKFPEYDTPVKRGHKVVVAGGGNVAMDAARVARRLGGEVTLVYRRRDEDLPARKAEIARAKEEGVKFVFCANPVKILGEQAVTGVECVEMRSVRSMQARGQNRAKEGERIYDRADVFIGAIARDQTRSSSTNSRRFKKANAGTSLSMRTAGLRSGTSLPVAMSQPVRQRSSLRWQCKEAAHAIDRMLKEE
jgi:glutamate synthase (NADPH/NADH) small chain